MNHWQLFIVGATFIYFIIAAGLYAWVTAKTQPYLGLLPPEITPAFMKMIFLVTSFGWPLVLQVYIYWEIVEKLGDLAGVKWKELASFDTIRTQFVNKDNVVLDSNELADSIQGKKVAERVAEISFLMEVDGRVKQAVFRDKETIIKLLGEPESMGGFLRSLARGVFDGDRFTSQEPVGERIQVPTAEEINKLIVSVPVAPMTRTPSPEEIIKLDNQSLMKLVYAITADRAVACQALGVLEADTFDYIEKAEPSLLTQTDQLEKSCAHARAVIEAWMDLVK